MELIEKINHLENQLRLNINALEKAEIECVKAETNYDQIKAIKTLFMKANGEPATLIDKLVKGDDEVITARIKWGVAEAKLSSVKEKIMAAKILLKGAYELRDLEWRIGGKNG